MKTLKLKWLPVLGGFVLLVVLMTSAACSPAGGQATNLLETPVERGDLRLTVSGSGSVEIVNELTLSSGVAGRVAEILVKEGELVSAEQALVKLESDSFDLALAQAEVTYAQTQISATQASIAVIQAVAALAQAEAGLITAQVALEQTIKSSTVSDVRVAQAELETAERSLAEAVLKLGTYSPGSTAYGEYQKTVVLMQARVKTAQDRLDAMLGGFSTDEVIVKEKQVTAAEQSLIAAQQSLELAKFSDDVAKRGLELADLSRSNAKKQLDKATLKAPFEGVIAKVYVKKGDSTMATTAIIQLMELEKTELKVLVDEIDIPEVMIGQKALIKVDAYTGEVLTGKVSYISLMPRKESGVTLFEVEIDIENSNSLALRSGMSASADIIIVEKTNAILVPSRAVKKNASGADVVEVMVNGQIQERPVTTGLSDGFTTEILSGLSEGETLVERRGQ